MSDGLDSLRVPGRVAGPEEGITVDELRLASRNHAMPMETLRDDLTPPGLHYVLTHYDIPAVDPATWRLEVDGAVRRPLTLDLAALQALPRHTVRVTMECAGNGRAALEPRPLSQPWLDGAVGTADWTGVRLGDLLAEAGLLDQAVDVVLTGADHGIERGVEQDYQRGLHLAEAMTADVLVADEMNGAPLPVQHGFPARVVVPGWYGMGNVKWLRRITVATERFDGFQNRAYRLRQEAGDEGEPVTRIEPRALLEPPGFPDFMTRTRVLPAGPTMLRGRAWSGWAPVTGVEVSTDDGASWIAAVLGPEQGRWAWRAFSAPWEATPGEHRLRARASDASGRVQPVDPAWNRGGFTNNADQGLPVVVVDGAGA
jgi:DMSO/TMAO reductase YedYZ molybdopterin-dependent catalytic subunit